MSQHFIIRGNRWKNEQQTEQTQIKHTTQTNFHKRVLISNLYLKIYSKGPKSSSNQSKENVCKTEQFLKHLKLEQFVQLFLDNGYQDFENFLNISSRELSQLTGIPSGYQIKLLKGIEQYKQKFIKEKIEEQKEEKKVDKRNFQLEIQTEKVEESIHKSCWNCYRLFDERYEKIIENKGFCSDKCIEQYRENTRVRIICSKCKKGTSQEEGILKFGEWYCQVECMPSEEELYIRLARMEL